MSSAGPLGGALNVLSRCPRRSAADIARKQRNISRSVQRNATFRINATTVLACSGAASAFATLLMWREPRARLVHTDSHQGSDDERRRQNASYAVREAQKTNETTNASWSLPTFELPAWARPESLARFRDTIDRLINQFDGDKDSLLFQLSRAKADAQKHPEVAWEAQVRLGDDLPISEKAFLRVRRKRMRLAFAHLFEVAPEEIDERDLPVVAVAGSGGGLRAMCNTLGSLSALEEDRILDCVSYASGISGSCWALGVLYSGVSGGDTVNAAISHALDRIKTSYVDSSVLDLLTNSPTNAHLLRGVIQKVGLPGGGVSLTDIYGTLVSSRIFVPEDVSLVKPEHLSLSKFSNTIHEGALPLPIFTAISRHLPDRLEGLLDEIKKEKRNTQGEEKSKKLEEAQQLVEEQTRWLWFEFTPYEAGCDELGAWIPSWSFGRPFNQGRNTEKLPELSFSILSGTFASAFCASLRHYLQEAQPALKVLPGPLLGWIQELIGDNEDEFDTLHPIVPNALPNYVKGLDGQLRSGSPTEITQPDTLGFMDAGADLNIPYYPLFRRDVDLVIALDASADSQDLWFTKAEELAIRRGLHAWPRGARWPAEVTGDSTNESPSSESASDSDVNRKLAVSQESEALGQQQKQIDSNERSVPSSNPRKSPQDSEKRVSAAAPLDHAGAHLWIGSSSTEDEDRPKRSFSASDASKLDEATLASHDGIGVLYFPLTPHPDVPDFDPMSVSTWRFELQADESQKLVEVAKSNIRDGEDMMVKVLKAIWQRKRNARLRGS